MNATPKSEAVLISVISCAVLALQVTIEMHRRAERRELATARSESYEAGRRDALELDRPSPPLERDYQAEIDEHAAAKREALDRLQPEPIEFDPDELERELAQRSHDEP